MMLINSNFEIGFLLVVFSLLGIVLIGSMFAALHLERWHPRLVGVTVGALVGLAVIEATTMIT